MAKDKRGGKRTGVLGHRRDLDRIASLVLPGRGLQGCCRCLRRKTVSECSVPTGIARRRKNAMERREI